MCQSVSQSSDREGGTLGTCSACFRTDIRVTAGGLMYCHGPKGARCMCVGKVPLAVTTTNHQSINQSINRSIRAYRPFRNRKTASGTP